MSVRYRPLAQVDVLELADQLGSVYPPVGRAFLDRVEETVRLLEQFPQIGAEPPATLPADPAIRFFPVRRFRNYLIAFKPLPDGNGIEVVRVIDGRRDLRGLFDDA